MDDTDSSFGTLGTWVWFCGSRGGQSYPHPIGLGTRRSSGPVSYRKTSRLTAMLEAHSLPGEPFFVLFGEVKEMPIIPRILYVDDDVDNCEMMKYWIREECGCDIAIAMDGKAALEMIESEYFDLFLLDYCLPDTTGIKLCERIRTLYPDAPIAVYSALDRPIDKQRALAAGATSYMIKPEELDQIKPFLAKHLSRPIPLQHSTENPTAASTSSKGIHRGRTRASGIV